MTCGARLSAKDDSSGRCGRCGTAPPGQATSVRTVEHVPDDLLDVGLRLAGEALHWRAFALDVRGDLGQVGLGDLAVEDLVGIERDVDAVLAGAEARIAADLDALLLGIELENELAQLLEHLAAALLGAVAAFADVAESVGHGRRAAAIR
jgi:hypothetical protein